MTARPVRLTRAEWQALVDAVAYQATELDTAELYEDDRAAAMRRKVAAAERALDKVLVALTTPAVRR